MIVIGEYSERGYMVLDDKGEVMYSAGNSHFDSTLELQDGDPNRVALHRIRSYCIQTTKEIAKEHGATYGGCERVKPT